MSQLVRYRQISNNVRAFKAATRMLIRRMMQRGHSWRMFRRVWGDFLAKYWDEQTVRRLRLGMWYKVTAIRIERDWRRCLNER